MQDTISDMITRIRNGHQARLGAITLHYSTSHTCIKLLEILYNEGYIFGFYEINDKKSNKTCVKVLLKYDSFGVPAIRSIYRISKPGRRLYASINSLWKSKNTAGIVILSTPKGLYIDRDAKILGIGGEVLCGVY